MTRNWFYDWMDETRQQFTSLYEAGVWKCTLKCRSGNNKIRKSTFFSSKTRMMIIQISTYNFQLQRNWQIPVAAFSCFIVFHIMLPVFLLWFVLLDYNIFVWNRLTSCYKSSGNHFFIHHLINTTFNFPVKWLNVSITFFYLIYYCKNCLIC